MSGIVKVRLLLPFNQTKWVRSFAPTRCLGWLLLTTKRKQLVETQKTFFQTATWKFGQFGLGLG